MSHYIFGADARYKVTAAAVVAVLVGGGQAYVYRGKPLPTNTRPDQLERLLTDGLIKEISHDDA